MELNVPDDYLMDLYELIWNQVKDDYLMPAAKRKALFAMMGDLYGARIDQMTPEEFRRNLDNLLNRN